MKCPNPPAALSLSFGPASTSRGGWRITSSCSFALELRCDLYQSDPAVRNSFCLGKPGHTQPPRHPCDRQQWLERPVIAVEEILRARCSAAPSNGGFARRDSTLNSRARVPPGRQICRCAYLEMAVDDPCGPCARSVAPCDTTADPAPCPSIAPWETLIGAPVFASGTANAGCCSATNARRYARPR